MDGNKTALTHRVTAAACAYLDLRGFKPIETEVSVSPKWIADIASFVSPSYTELKNLKLVANKYCEETSAEELYYRYGSPLTAIVEVKTAISDFRGDQKFTTKRLPAHLCYLAYPKAMIKPEDIPPGWIGLETSADGEKVIKTRMDYMNHLHRQGPGDVIDLIAAVAVRRDNRTRYAAQREFVKARNARENDREKSYRLLDIVSGLLDWIQYKGCYKDCTAEELLKQYRLKHVPDYLKKKMIELETLRSKK